MNTNELALLIIAGGKSSRMGQDKRRLSLGAMTMLERNLVQGKAAGFGEIYLCVEARSPFLRELADKYAVTLLTDKAPGLGPLSGLTQGLCTMQSSWGLAIAGDMPFIELAALCRWGQELPTAAMALLPVAAGQLQPLAAFYHVKTAPHFQQALTANKRAIRQILDSFPHQAREYTNSAAHFFNVNTPADWRLAQGRSANLQRKTPLIAITAPASGTGKTTFIEKLLPRLRARGIKTGVVKSDCHGFQLDMQGKDSFRFAQAGAQGVAVVSPAGWFMVQKTGQSAPLTEITANMQGMDLILTESRTQYSLPAISLWRGQGQPMTDEQVTALFTTDPQSDNHDIYEFHIDDCKKAVEICLFLMGR